MRLHLTLALLLATGGAASAQSATQDWPCIQPRQPQLSLGQMWAGPAPDAASDALARGDAGVRDLAGRLALRRVSDEDAAAMIASFATANGDAAHLTALMQAVLSEINDERGAIIEGIARYGHGQGAVAERIATRRTAMDQMQKAATPDFDAIDAEEQKLDWDTRIFEERRQMLSAVCDSPVLLEQRAFSLARLIQAQLPGQAAATPTRAP